ncbi:unnamed protein product [Rhizophagus irregularis]|nr:unnamed protein product [Rhizophagus irregularis]
MSGSNYPTLGTLLLLLDHLSDHTTTTIQNLYNTNAYLALVLDPLYKTQILPDNINEEDLKQMLTNKFNNYQNLEKLFDEDNNDTLEGNKRKSIGLLDHMLQKKKKSNNSQSHNEINEYLIIPLEPSNINPCEWWKNHKSHYPLLSKIARDYIGILSTFVPSE